MKDSVNYAYKFINWFLLCIILLLSVGCTTAIEQPGQDSVEFVSGKVMRVIDGDTAVVALGKKEEKVRFIGVNTPESTTRHEPYGKLAYNFTRQNLLGKRLYLEFDVGQRDKYGRMLAYLWLQKPTDLSDGEIREKMFNARLLLEGYAQVMTVQPNSKYADKFVVYQREAREAQKGLWGKEDETSPAVLYVTKTGTKYHREDCAYLQESKIPVSVKVAKEKFEPCSKCN